MVENELRTTQLTWAALLSYWMEFAKASVALPNDAEGRRWKDSIAPIIALQAVTFAVSTVHELPRKERGLGMDRAEILIRENTRRLNAIWRGIPMSTTLLELMDDAQKALRTAEMGMVLEFVLPGEDVSNIFEMPDCEEELRGFAAAGFSGLVDLAAPGTLFVDGEPIGFVRSGMGGNGENEAELTEEDDAAWMDAVGRLRDRLAPAILSRRVDARQVYREIDERGRIVGDVISFLSSAPRAGRPLILRAYEGGRIREFGVSGEDWRSQQERAWPRDGSVFSVDLEDDAG